MTTQQLLTQIDRRLAAIERRLEQADEQLLTTNQAATALGCSGSALRMRVARGAMPCTKAANGRLYFRKIDINTQNIVQ